MKSKAIQAALKILLIQEEYNASEINEAISLIKSDGESTPLFSFLASENGKSQTKDRSKKAKKNISEQSSQILMDLKKNDHGKFQILSEFDSLLRKGLILKGVNDIKMLAAKISKEFPAVKTRRDAIPKLVELLLQLPNDEIRKVIEEALAEAKLSIESSEYQELAHFLIKGQNNSD